MFSFEGHYKKQRSVNYSKQKDVGKKDLMENARLEREKRALLSRQIKCATVIQAIFRKYSNRKKIKKESLDQFEQLLLKITSLDSYDSCYYEVIMKMINCLLKFFNCSSNDDNSLKSLINLLNTNDIIANLFGGVQIQNYYHAVSLSLLLRLTAKYLKYFPENSPPVSYNVYLRFFEKCFHCFKYLNNENSLINRRHKLFFLLLINSKYFNNISEFVYAQLVWRNEPAHHIFTQMKAKSILKVLLAPIEKAANYSMLHLAVIQYVNNIYSSDSSSRLNNSLNALKLMCMAVLDMVSLNSFIDCIFVNEALNINISSGLLLLVLISVVDIKIDSLNPEIAAKTLILFFKISRTLYDKSLLYLSNDLPECAEILSDSQTFIRDDLDFEMRNIEEEESSDDESPEPLSERTDPVKMSIVEQEIALILKSKFCQIIVPQATQFDGNEAISKKLICDSIGYLYHLLILETKIIGSSESKTFILNLIQTSKYVSKILWSSVIEQKLKECDTSLMQSLILGQIRSIDNDMKEFFGKLLCFANCLHWRLLSVQDLDLIKIDSEDSSKVIEFTPDELCDIVLKLRDIMYGLILLIYPQPNVSKFQPNTIQNSLICTEKFVKMFIELQRVVIRLYNRDVRKGLKMSGKRLEWVKPRIGRINLEFFKKVFDSLYVSYKFGSLRPTQVAPIDWRQIVILKEMPFIIPIGTRMKLFKELINSMNYPTYYARVPPIKIRRDYLYEDAFTQIKRKTFSNLRSYLKIEFIDRFGMNEPGVDGGGLLREFLRNIIIEACDPKRGLFVSTKNNLIYPNPELEIIYPDNWKEHLDFFGRMLGLMIFKGLLVEAPFAPFFIQKLFNNTSSREEIDIDNLQYLDEDLYRNLLSLKSMDKVEDINLDFTVSRACYGVSRIVELKPNGEHISVTNSNKIEYIYLVANYKLNRQISKQTSLIINGLNDVVPIECFQLFDSDEISFIITGGDSLIDLEDLQRNTVYHGVEDPDSSEIIQTFWRVLFEMSEDEKRNFIQFVTSISRAPMLGFGELSPKFAIQIVPDTDRLPTASTCINLLKLPAYQNMEEMREKLLYAIGSDSGFQLS